MGYGCDNEPSYMKRSIPFVFVLILVTGFISFVVAGPYSRDLVSKDKWFCEIEKLTEMDKVSPPPQGGVVFVGSSSIRMWKSLESDFPDIPVIRRGFGGSHMSDALYFADRIVIAYKPGAVVLYEGDNDLQDGKSIESITREYQLFCERIHQSLPDCQIHFIAVKASLARWENREKIQAFNQSIRQFSAQDSRLKFIDVFQPMLGDDGLPRKSLLDSDDLHLSSEGYKLWTQVIRQSLDSADRSPNSR